MLPPAPRVLLATSARWIVMVLCVTVMHAVESLRWDQREQVFTPSWQAADVTARFGCTNISDRPVSITNVRSTCGCVVSAPEKSTLAPGESSAVTVKFSFGARVGVITKQIFVTTDRPDEQMIELRLSVTIPQVVTITPSFVYWSVGGIPREQVVSVQVLPDIPFTVQALVAPSALVQATWVPSADGRSGEVHITPVSTTTPWNAGIALQGPDGREFVIFARCINPDPRAAAPVMPVGAGATNPPGVRDLPVFDPSIAPVDQRPVGDTGEPTTTAAIPTVHIPRVTVKP